MALTWGAYTVVSPLAFVVVSVIAARHLTSRKGPLSGKALPLALLTALAMPALAFWVDNILSSQVWYMRTPGLVGAVLNTFHLSYFLSPILLIAQLVVLIGGWTNLTPGLKPVAVVLLLVTALWVVLPFTIRIG
jgi:hypothetical protein